MASFNYVGSPNTNLICCVCRMPFIEPVTAPCTHTFCDSCIKDALSHSPLCPIDRSPLDVQSLVQADPIVRSLVDELLVECVHKSEGCEVACERYSLATHLKEDCLFSTVSCPFDTCESVMMRRDVTEHNCLSTAQQICETCSKTFAEEDFSDHVESCKTSDATCPHCSNILDSSEKISHHESCESVPVGCSQSVHGCPWNGIRSDLNGHLKSCPYEAIKGFFAVNNSKTATLKEENIVLRAKVQNLERITQTMNRELNILKGVLGPWFRTESIASPSAIDFSTQTPVLDTALSSAPLSPGLDQRSPIDLEGNSLQQFGRSSLDDVTSPGYPSSRMPRIQHRGSSSIGQYPDLLNQPSVYPHSVPQTPVAPLNLSTSLEGSMEGLRDSLVTLASSVDSLGRRNDVALTNETRRLNEEVMSIRAAIHGLRLQVHNIMMDRNAQVTGRVPSDGPLPPGQVEGGWLPPPRPFFPPMVNGPPSITKL